jgi:hypothetical protein
MRDITLNVPHFDDFDKCSSGSRIPDFCTVKPVDSWHGCPIGCLTIWSAELCMNLHDNQHSFQNWTSTKMTYLTQLVYVLINISKKLLSCSANYAFLFIEPQQFIISGVVRTIKLSYVTDKFKLNRYT